MTHQRPGQHFGLLQRYLAQQQTGSHPTIKAPPQMAMPEPSPHPSPVEYNLDMPLPEELNISPPEDFNATILIPFLDPQQTMDITTSESSNSQKLQSIETPKISLTTPTKTSKGTSSEQPFLEGEIKLEETTPAPEAKKTFLSLRIVACTLVLLLTLTLYFVWRPTAASSHTDVVTSSPLTKSTGTGSPNNLDNIVETTTDSIQVYIVGAIQHPGVYTLPTSARVLQLLQAAGGPLPKANLVAINLAAKLRDGQEVYITLLGEKPPTYVGGVPGPGTGDTTSTDQAQLVNINSASVDEMKQQLHLSSTSAQAIADYRQQHGSFTTIEELLLVVSQSIYDKIKGLVTV
jgi:competence protein ComEA